MQRKKGSTGFLVGCVWTTRVPIKTQRTARITESRESRNRTRCRRPPAARRSPLTDVPFAPSFNRFPSAVIRGESMPPLGPTRSSSNTDARLAGAIRHACARSRSLHPCILASLHPSLLSLWPNGTAGVEGFKDQRIRSLRHPGAHRQCECNRERRDGSGARTILADKLPDPHYSLKSQFFFVRVSNC